MSIENSRLVDDQCHWLLEGTVVFEQENDTVEMVFKGSFRATRGNERLVEAQVVAMTRHLTSLVCLYTCLPESHNSDVPLWQ